MISSGTIRTIRVALLALTLVSPAIAADANSYVLVDVPGTSPKLDIPAPRARMSPELALQAHDARTKRQALELSEYRDTTIIEAELPQSAQKGRYQLQRIFSAPKSLAFKAVNFAGDGFVKTQVIARILQSEVDHAKKDDNASIAITSANYKFSYKGLVELDGGDPVHLFQVKPRQKRPGLFKGKIYIDVYTGAMRHAEGVMVKSPSFFVKNIHFLQDYAEVSGFDMVSHVHSTADVRIVGKTIVDIQHTDVQARSIYDVQAGTGDVQPQAPAIRPASFSVGRPQP